jgi:hypothetical protein
MSRDAILATIPEDGWYVVLEGEQIGPISRDALLAHVDKGVADSATYVWRQGFDEWQKLGDAKGWGDVLKAGKPGKAAASTPVADDRTSVVPMNLAAMAGSDDWDATLVEMERPAEVSRAAQSPRTDDLSTSGDSDRTTMVPAGHLAHASARIAADQRAPEPAKASAATDLDALFGDEDPREGQAPSSSGGGFFAVSEKKSDSPKLTHQRRETSVLFSLDDLDGKQKKETAFAEKKTESGLIDIRAVAKKESQAAASKQTAGDLFAEFGASDSAPAAFDTRLDTTQAPLMQRKKQGAPWGLVAGIVLLVGGGAGGFIWWQQQQQKNQPAAPQNTAVAVAPAPPAAPPAPPAQPPAPPAQPPAPPAQPPAPAPAQVAAAPAAPAVDTAAAAAAANGGPPGPNSAGAAAAPAAPDAGQAAAANPGGEAKAPDAAPPDAGKPPEAAQPTSLADAKKAAEAKAKAEKLKAEKAQLKAQEAEVKAQQAEAIKQAPPPSDGPKAPKGPSSEATALLNMVNTGSTPSAPPAAGGAAATPPADGVPETLSSNDIRKAMRGHQSAFVSCYTGGGAAAEGPVTVNAKLVVASSGNVTSASVSGPIAGTSAANCIESKLKSVSFPKFRQDSQTVSVPIRLQ